MAEESFDESLGGKKEEMRSISKKHAKIPKICAVCFLWGAIVDQVFALTLWASKFLASFLWVSPWRGAVDLLAVKMFFLLRIFANVAQRFFSPRYVLVNQRKGIGNKRLKTKMNANEIFHGYFNVMTFESQSTSHLSGCCALTSFSSVSQL